MNADTHQKRTAWQLMSISWFEMTPKERLRMLPRVLAGLLCLSILCNLYQWWQIKQLMGMIEALVL